MTSVVGEKSVTGMIGTLCDALENEFGILVPRLYRILKPLKGFVCYMTNLFILVQYEGSHLCFFYYSFAYYTTNYCNVCVQTRHINCNNL